MGAQPPGMLRGATNIYGFKQECDIIHYKIHGRSRPFETMYSGAFIDGVALAESQNATCDPSKTFFVRFDMCLPKSCSANDLLAVIKDSE